MRDITYRINRKRIPSVNQVFFGVPAPRKRPQKRQVRKTTVKKKKKNNDRVRGYKRCVNGKCYKVKGYKRKSPIKWWR